ncbi:MAG TPA: hypothetical protein ENJ18_16575 [Nannocystis exedens]|nr:hypothetical protein [Nannocystis exedens]
MACNGEGMGEAGSESATAGTMSTGSESGPTDTETGPNSVTGTTDSSTGEPGGDLRGLINFIYYPADAAVDQALLGVAGAYRMEEFAFDDIYALAGLQLHQLMPPADLDSVEEFAPQPFEWGPPSSWIAAGNGIRFARSGGGVGLACLTLADDAYPLYLAAESDALDPACAPDPAAWLPETEYSLALYGGELFEDEILSGVRTPAALSVSAPDFSVYNLEVNTQSDLQLVWAASEDPEASIIIRVWDQYGQGLVAKARDDGEFKVPAANLAALSGGPGFVTLARELRQTSNFSAGSVRVLTRYEVWGYVDFIE